MHRFGGEGTHDEDVGGGTDDFPEGIRPESTRTDHLQRFFFAKNPGKHFAKKPVLGQQKYGGPLVIARSYTTTSRARPFAS